MNKEYCKDCSHCDKWWKDEYVYQLETALDLACEKLENLSYVKGLGQVGMCYAEWKEYLLKKVKE